MHQESLTSCSRARRPLLDPDYKRSGVGRQVEVSLMMLNVQMIIDCRIGGVLPDDVAEQAERSGSAHELERGGFSLHSDVQQILTIVDHQNARERTAVRRWVPDRVEMNLTISGAQSAGQFV